MIRDGPRARPELNSILSVEFALVGWCQSVSGALLRGERLNSVNSWRDSKLVEAEERLIEFCHSNSCTYLHLKLCHFLGPHPYILVSGPVIGQFNVCCIH